MKEDSVKRGVITTCLAVWTLLMLLIGKFWISVEGIMIISMPIASYIAIMVFIYIPYMAAKEIKKDVENEEDI